MRVQLSKKSLFLHLFALTMSFGIFVSGNTASTIVPGDAEKPVNEKSKNEAPGTTKPNLEQSTVTTSLAPSVVLAQTRVLANSSIQMQPGESPVQFCSNYMGEILYSKNTSPVLVSKYSNYTVNGITNIIQNLNADSSALNQVYASNANGVERGGGDLIAIEFITYARAFLRDINRLHHRGLFPGISEENIANAISQFRINPSNEIIYDHLNQARDLVTDPGQKTIEIYIPAWNANSSNRRYKAFAVIHEYLRASGYSDQDDLYNWSQQIFNTLLNDASGGAFVLSITNNQIDESLFQRAMGTANIYCKTKTQDSSVVVLTFTPSSYGMNVGLTSINPNRQFTFSDINENLVQVTYGSYYTTVVLKLSESNLDSAAKLIHVTMPSIVTAADDSTLTIPGVGRFALNCLRTGVSW